MNRPPKAVLIIGIVLFVYGCLCRLVGLKFFWEARPIGGTLLFVALLLYWIGLRKRRKIQGKETMWVTIGIGVLAFSLLLVHMIVVIFLNAEAYRSAKAYLASDPRIKKEAGEVHGFRFFPSGSVRTSITNGEESGDAFFAMTVHGEKKNMDVKISLSKEPGTPWTVLDLR